VAPESGALRVNRIVAMLAAVVLYDAVQTLLWG
jgi:hypothetical protein